MKDLIQICLDVISNTQSKDLTFDWEYGTYIVNFQKNSNRYELEFERKFFGFISEIRLKENQETISEDNLTKEEFKMLKKAYIDRDYELKEIRFKKAFSDIQRDNKINQLIN